MICRSFLLLFQTYEFNLHLTAVLSRLAAYSHPLLDLSLFSTRKDLTSHRNVYSILKKVMNHQSFNQWTSQPISQSINQSINQSVDQSISWSINQSMNQLVNQSMIQLVNQSINQWTNCQLINRSMNQLVNQSMN